MRSKPDGLIPDAGDAGTSVRLLVRARGGDRSALAALLERQLPGLVRFARGRLPRWARGLADTADLVQDTLLGAVRNLDRFEARRRGALGAYLRASVMNRVRDEIRKVSRGAYAEPLYSEPVANPREAPDVKAADAEVRDRFRAALAHLGEGDQQAVVARIELGYSYEQIALMLGKASPDAARMAVARAVARLASRMAH